MKTLKALSEELAADKLWLRLRPETLRQAIYAADWGEFEPEKLSSDPMALADALILSLEDASDTVFNEIIEMLAIKFGMEMDESEDEPDAEEPYFSQENPV